MLMETNVFGQRSTFLGASGNLTYDTYEYTDPGNLITSIPMPNGSWGILAQQEINSHFLFETGFIRKYYSEGYGVNISSPFIGMSSNSFETYQIPFRIKSRLNLFQDKVYLSTITGFNLSVNSEYGYGLGHGGSTSHHDGNIYVIEYTEDVNQSRTFPLFETGVSLDLAILKNIYVSAQVSYFSGMKKVSQIDYEYTVNNSDIQHAYAHSNGNYWGIGLGIFYRISEIWKK